MSEIKNNVTRFLDGQKIKYQAFAYDYDAGIQSAVEVAQDLGLPADQVFKTLVVLPEEPKRKPMLVVVPGSATLDLKALAKAVNLKKAKMAAHDQAEALTGLQTGGISALALINKGFDVYLDDRANNWTAIAVSAGQRGLNVLVPLADFVRLTRARVVHLQE